MSTKNYLFSQWKPFGDITATVRKITCLILLFLTVGIGNSKAAQGDVPITIQKSDLGSIYNTTKTVNKTVSSSNDLAVCFSGVNTKSKADANTDYTYMMFTEDAGYCYSNSAPTGYYPSSVTVTFTAGTGTNGKAGITFSTSASSSRNTSVNGSVSKSGTCSLTNSDETKKYWNFSTTTKNVQVASIEVVYSLVSSSQTCDLTAPTVSKSTRCTGVDFTLSNIDSNSSYDYIFVSPSSNQGTSSAPPTSGTVYIGICSNSHNSKFFAVQ